jgi:hypothetical protein
MAHQLTSPSGREDNGLPRLWTAGDSARRFDADLYLRVELGVRPGESDAGQMLGWVLLIVAAAVVVGILTLMWWLV